VAVDAAGNLYITTGNCRVREVDLAGLPALTLQNVTPASALLSYNSSSNSVFTALNGNGATNAGNFSVIVSSLYGSVTSSIVPLTVVFPPSITAQPASLAVTNGGTANFAVTAVGTAPLAFQWYGNNQALGNGASNLLTINPVNGNWAGNYYCVITNSYGSVTSRVATLTLALPPTVSVPPAGQTNLAGTAVTFNVKAGGTGPFAYQWQFNGTNLPNNLITTVAGNGTNGFAGDGGAATNASLWGPWFAAVDANGCVLISDNGNRRVRRVDTNGVITTVAGNGNTVYSGDGLPATNNGFYTISGVALDGYGIWYVGDAFFNRIHQVNGSGIMTTVVGGGPGYGVGYFAGDGGAATSAVLYDPNGVAVDAVGNLFLADTKNNRVRKVDPTGTITTVAGKGPSTGGPGGFSGDGGVATNASLNYPNSVAVDAAGDLFLADSNNQLIRKVDTNGIITTVAGNLTNSYAGDGGAATNASLSSPKDVKVDAWGNLYIADCGNNRIRRVDPNGIITTVAGNGTNAYAGDGSAATNASLANPTGVALDAAGNLIIVDYNNNRVREVFLAGTPTLALNNLNLSNAGNYSVIITSPYGSVTSSVVSLTVTIPTTPPQIISGGTNFGFLTNQFGFNLNGAYGQTIVVDGSTNLLDWTPLFTNTANGAPFYFFDPAWTNFPWRFYRARLPASP
jgi:sugar lactone lactonase YvrE